MSSIWLASALLVVGCSQGSGDATGGSASSSAGDTSAAAATSGTSSASTTGSTGSGSSSGGSATASGTSTGVTSTGGTSTGGTSTGGTSSGGTSTGAMPPDTIGTPCSGLSDPSCPSTAPTCTEGEFDGGFFCSAHCQSAGDCVAVGAASGTVVCNESTDVCYILCGERMGVENGNCPPELQCLLGQCE